MNKPLMLIADDDTNLVALIKSSRVAEIFNIITTSTLNGTYKALTETSIDFVLLDNGFSDGQAYRVIEELIAVSKNKDVCLVFATSDHEETRDFEQVAIEQGAHGFMYKPIVSKPRLYRQISNIWRQHLWRVLEWKKERIVLQEPEMKDSMVTQS